ncbi:MAG TPA: HD-GYP domain-containing protein [Bdellovibrionales bacterium]|nr:HD-GYP domain-containing protein [Bdellovibrionales bacterium]
METVRVKDVATYEHCIRVSRGVRLLAQAAGLNELDQKVVEFAGLFHDIGKIGVPDEILLKPARLTDAEFAIMKEHPEKSVQILQPLTHVEFYKQMIPGIRYHHERFDGSGYPHEIAGEDIPLESRLILVVDTFDAMTADRAYRKGLPVEVAIQELKDWAGRQFDPQLVKIFCEAQPKWKPRDYKVVEEMNHEVLARGSSIKRAA